MLEDPPLLTVRRRFERLGEAELAPFRDCITGWLADAQGGRGALDAAIKPLALEVPGMARLLGTALPCWCGPNDNLAAMAAIALAEPGDVILAACEGFAGAGMAGDIMLGLARNQGVAGLVTDGMVRDRAGIIGVGLPVFCRGTTANSCVRSGPGSIGLPIVIGGVPVSAGDFVLGDADGVVVVPRAALGAVGARVALIRAAEARIEAELRGGMGALAETTALLASARVRWID